MKRFGTRFQGKIFSRASVIQEDPESQLDPVVNVNTLSVDSIDKLGTTNTENSASNIYLVTPDVTMTKITTTTPTDRSRSNTHSMQLPNDDSMADRIELNNYTTQETGDSDQNPNDSQKDSQKYELDLDSRAFLEPKNLSTQERIKYFFSHFKNRFVKRSNSEPLGNGRIIPISLDKMSSVYQEFHTDKRSHLLMDERKKYHKPYCDNMITSSRYNVYTFLPRQFYAQFSKIANCYFMIVAILQMIPGWSTTGSYTTIIPLCVFIGISMMREAYEDYKRHKLDRDENLKKTHVLLLNNSNGKTNLKKKLKRRNHNRNAKMETTNVPETSNSPDNDNLENHTDYFSNLELLKTRHQVDLVETEWKNLRVGDFVYLRKDDWVPADMLLICSDNENNEVFVETMALDGETNLKNKQPHAEISAKMSTATGLLNTQGKATVEEPNIDLYNFDGNIELLDSVSGTWTKYPLDCNNVMYRGSIVRNTSNCIGMVIYSGEETKIRMNSIKNPRTKAPKLQRNINIIVIFMVLIVAAMSLFSFLGQTILSRKYIENNRAWYLLETKVTTAQSIMGFLIMYNTLIPLSLYVTMEIIKVMQSQLMEWDIDMYHRPTDTSCESRTVTILEELGQVSYIFSDKTGTLTDNLMIFRKFSVCGSSWLHNLDDLDKQLDEAERYQDFTDTEGLQRKLSNTSSVDSHVSVISDIDSPVVQNLLHPRTSQGNVSLKMAISNGTASMHPKKSIGRPSVDYSNYGSTNYTGRPSIASHIQIAEEEQVRKSFSEPPKKTEKHKSSHSHSSTASSAGAESLGKIKTTLELIMYVQRHPDTFFSKRIKFFLLSLALCHTCLPKRRLAKPTHAMDNEPEEEDEDERITTEYQAASPDELALIVAARDLGFVMVSKNSNIITIKTYPDGFEKPAVMEEYEVMNVIEFNSDRKRMSVLLRDQREPGKVLLLCKGADNVILERLYNNKLAVCKSGEVNQFTSQRKQEEAELVLDQRRSLSRPSFRLSHSSKPQSRVSVDIASRPSLSLQQVRMSLSKQHSNINHGTISLEADNIDSIDAFVENINKNKHDIDNIASSARKSFQKQQIEKYRGANGAAANLLTHSLLNSKTPVSANTNNQNTVHSSGKTAFDRDMEKYIGSDELCKNEEYVIERTLQALEEFSTDGLRTLLYSYKWIDETEYDKWADKYYNAKTSLVNRAGKMQEVGELIETDLVLLGATGIEDKLQDGVPEAIDKIRRAGIKMWMLTGDKRETAINIGYSCNLIHDYSTVLILSRDDDNVLLKITTMAQELEVGDVAHSVVVIDGSTLATFEVNPAAMSSFIDLCTKTDVVICCRASPSQKAFMVSSIKKTDDKMVTLAVGDGANDIAMIQSADIGIGIAGKEGLQASRSSDYSIGQFRFLLKLLLVHGRYNYSRTSKFVLSTFYKESFFFVTQMIYQRWTMFSGTSMYEPWSLSMFNTLFTSLPVLCIGMFQKDLKPSTLLAVPELYTYGRMSQGFNLRVFIGWLLLAGCSSVIITFLNVELWGVSAVLDGSKYPLGLINYTVAIFIINIKIQFLEMRNRSSIEFASVLISCLGWLAWCCFLPAIYAVSIDYDVKSGLFHHFGRDYTFWAMILVSTTIPLLIDMISKVLKNAIAPTDSDIFAQLEQEDEIRKKLELNSFSELQQGWTWEKDRSTFSKYTDRVVSSVLPAGTLSLNDLPNSILSSSVGSDVNIDDATSTNNDVESSQQKTKTGSRENNNKKNNTFDSSRFEVLPSGKIIKRADFDVQLDETNGSSKEGTTNFKTTLAKTLRFKLQNDKDDEEDIEAIIANRMKDLE